MNSSTNGVVLFVNGFEDEVLERIRAAMQTNGESVERVADVYDAMARLSESPAVSRVIVDMRYLDAAEAAFLRQATRYYHGVELVIPMLDGLTQRVEWDSPGIQMVSPEELGAPPVFHAIDSGSRMTGAFADEPRHTQAPVSEDGIPWATTAEEAAWLDESEPAPGDGPDTELDEHGAEPPRSMPLVPDRPLSTDVGPNSGDEESLHDAVRRRMAGDDPRVIRRRPPQSPPSESNDVSTPFGDESPAEKFDDDDDLTADEMDALLDDDDFDLPEDPDIDEETR